MFYILMILGVGFIVLGIFTRKRYNGMGEEKQFLEEIEREESKDNKILLKDDTKLLEKRIDLLEELLFKKTLKEERNKKPLVIEDEAVEVENDSIEKYHLIKKYEKENKDIDEISKLLNMNKGEVLLLKSLYKNS